MIKIYGSPTSRAARCLWALEELALPYERMDVDNADGSGRSDAYLALNADGKVPMLCDGPVAITQSYAINLYLAQTYGIGRLWPDEPSPKAAALQWSFWVATETEPNIASLYFQNFQVAPEYKSKEIIEKSTNEIHKSFQYLNSSLEQAPFLAGKYFGIADLNVAAGLRNAAKLGIDVSRHAALDQWLRGCLLRPAHLKILEM